MLIDLGVSDRESLDEIEKTEGFASFLRQLTGLDRAAAKGAFSDFAAKQALSADQNEFVDLIVDFLTENGTVDPRLFYESPFTDFDDMGILGVFSKSQTKEIVDIVSALNRVAAA